MTGRVFHGRWKAGEISFIVALDVFVPSTARLLFFDENHYIVLESTCTHKASSFRQKRNEIFLNTGCII